MIGGTCDKVLEVYRRINISVLRLCDSDRRRKSTQDFFRIEERASAARPSSAGQCFLRPIRARNYTLILRGETGKEKTQIVNLYELMVK
jgi:hypothetical protein